MVIIAICNMKTRENIILLIPIHVVGRNYVVMQKPVNMPVNIHMSHIELHHVNTVNNAIESLIQNIVEITDIGVCRIFFRHVDIKIIVEMNQSNIARILHIVRISIRKQRVGEFYDHRSIDRTFSSEKDGHNLKTSATAVSVRCSMPQSIGSNAFKSVFSWIYDQKCRHHPIASSL